MKNSVLFICDISPNFSGQAIISNETLNILKKHTKIYHVPLSYKPDNSTSLIYKLNFLIRFISTSLKFYYNSKKRGIIYFTPSRGTISIYRDLLILLFLNFIDLKYIKVFAHLHGSDMKSRINQSIFKTYFHNSYKKFGIKIILLDKGQEKFALGDKYKNYSYIQNFTKNLNVNRYKKIIDTRHSNFINFKKNTSVISFVHLSGVSMDKGLNYSILFVYYLNKMTHKKTKFNLKVIGWSKEDFLENYPNHKSLLEIMESEDLIKFHGKIYNREVIKKFLAMSHFNLLLSKLEAQPLSLIEGASLGCFSIVHKAGFIQELLNKIDGKIINRNSIKKEANNFLNLISKVNLNYYSFSRVEKRSNKIINIFSRSAFKNNLLDLLI